MNNGMMKTAGEGPKQFDVPAAMGNLLEAIEALDETLGRFQGRLHSITRHEPGNEKACRAVASSSCDLGNSIRAHAERIRDMESRLQEHMAALEV